MKNQLKFDKLFYNGNIYTMTGEKDRADFIGVLDGKIAAVGKLEDWSSVQAEKKYDLEGRTVIPGLSDTHMHLYMDCLAKQSVDLSEAHSFNEICEKMKAACGNVVPGKWLKGKNLHMERLKEQCFPTVDVLDSISNEIPIVISSFCGHANMVNSKVLEIAGIGKGYVPEITGTVEFFEDGRPNGIIREETYQICVESKMPELSFDEAADAVADYLKECASVGLTTLHPNAIEDPYNLELFQRLKEEGKLLCRIVYYPTNLPVTSTGAVSGFGDDLLKLGADKMFMDGSVGAASSAMKEPYADKDTCGFLVMSQEEADRKVKEAYDAGMDVAVHAIGDRAISMILTSFERAYQKERGWKQRFYLIHGYLPDFADLERMKKLPLIVNTQPVFIRNFVGMAKQRLGEKRTEKAFPLRTFLDNGILTTGSSDAPVQTVNPFYGIECSVTRKAPGYEEVLGAGEAVSVYEAVDMYTRQAAYVGKDEDKKGTLETGKLADFVVLQDDIFHIPAEEIHNTKVFMTVMDGKIVYKA